MDDLDEQRLPEDNVYEPTLEEEQAFVQEVLPAKYAEEQVGNQRRSTKTEWSEYSYETKGGKGIAVKHDEMGSLWSVNFTSGGELPKELSGKFTSWMDATKAVELYLAKQG